MNEPEGGASRSQLRGRDLMTVGWEPGRALGDAVTLANDMVAEGLSTEETLNRLRRLWIAPESLTDDPRMRDLADSLVRARTPTPPPAADALFQTPVEYRVWGAQHIDAGAREQMDVAMRLPVTVAGALMPDAHVGYGLPIGGVLATKGSVIPYGIGVDIACRMRLTIFEEEMKPKKRFGDRLERALREATYFGAGVKNPDRPDHPVLHEDTWSETVLLRTLRQIAINQLGTSGSGNHFVEFGELEIQDGFDTIEPGTYLALLSHSGSRGVGFKIASHYTSLAKGEHPNLEKAASNLSWLDLDHESGMEYWRAMELAGRFAAANHQVIHEAVAADANLEPLTSVENHHNFAWKEQFEGEEVIVHRKGATPAGPGVMGIIPGSMADPGYLVRGRGVVESLNSAAHGAGRAMGRKAAERQLTRKDRDTYLAARNVTLLGGGLDEAPQAYKRIEDVIAAQADLVDIVGVFTPRIVRMDKGGGQDI